MSREGVDYAWGKADPATLKRHGKTFVVRYVSTPGNSKNITKQEVKDFQKAGIDIAIVFETDSNRTLKGYAAGVYDAESALAQVKAVGGPAKSVIYFAADFDASGSEITLIQRYLQGAAHVLGKDRVGIYGSYDVIRACVPAYCKYGWQTYAWSHGAVHPRACLYQYNIFGKIEGFNVDLDRALKDDFGQWWYESPTPPKEPVGLGGAPQTGSSDALPGPAKKPAWFWLALKKFLANRKKASA